MLDDERAEYADAALREGLRALHVPEISADFDARVCKAVSRRAPWWKAILPDLRPMLSGAAVSLCATVALLRWFDVTPAPLTITHGHAGAAVEAAVDRSDLSEATLAGLPIRRVSRNPAPAEGPHPDHAPRRSELLRSTQPAPRPAV